MEERELYFLAIAWFKYHMLERNDKKGTVLPHYRYQITDMYRLRGASLLKREGNWMLVSVYTVPIEYELERETKERELLFRASVNI